jgi:hypothetical protein
MTARKKGSTRAGGSVAFVGAGPGDDGLLTLRAVDRLGEADVVVVDQLPREAMIAKHCRPDVEVLDAGFGEDGQPMTRASRAKLVVTAAKAGNRVVRLLDGDPATFTGLAEEIAACRKQSLAFAKLATDHLKNDRPQAAIDAASERCSRAEITPMAVSVGSMSNSRCITPSSHPPVTWYPWSRKTWIIRLFSGSTSATNRFTPLSRAAWARCSSRI